MREPESSPSWIDDIILRAQEEGQFDDLPGTGMPIPGAGKRDDALWWVRAWIERNRDSGESEPR